jgi:hypothetical protein
VKHEITDLAASVNQRLLNLRDLRKEDFQIILNRFGLERFLFRISRSSFFDQLILKGAFSFELWGKDLYRPTRDADFLCFFEPSVEEIRRIFALICQQDVEPDGLVFDPESVSVSVIREPNMFRGFRVRLTAYLQRIRIHLQFDVCAGERIKLKPGVAEFPTILPFPAPRILVYPKEFTIADKFHAMCKLGMLNSRVKDYYDIFQLSRHFPFMGIALKRGISVIFVQERAIIPSGIPDALTDTFGQISEKRTIWKRFLVRIEKESLDLAFDQVIESIREFILPPAKSAAEKKRFDLYWPPGGPWRNKSGSDGNL